MLREPLKPANDVDAAILKALQDFDTGHLGNLGAQVPSALFDYLKDLFGDRRDVARWRQLAEALESGGFRASAIESYVTLADEEPHPARKGQIYEHLMGYAQGLGLSGTATIYRRVANRFLGRRDPADSQPELESGELYVLTARNDPVAYQRILEGLGDYSLRHDPLRDPFGTKRIAHSGLPDIGNPLVDECSFFIMNGEGQAIMQVEADVALTRYLGCHETGIILTPLVEDHSRRREAEGLAVRQLRLLLEWSGAPAIMFDSGESLILPLEVRSWIIESQRSMVPYTAAWIDLTWDAERIEANYREAHRQSLRWGRKNVIVTSCTTPDAAMLRAYDEVFAALGRTPGVTSETVAEYLARGFFTLYIGSVDNAPMVALLSSRHGKTTYYWASAKLRLGNKPLGHVVLHQAIMDAKAEGQTCFDFGMLQDAACYNEKLRSIALYKRGFATHMESRTFYYAKL